MRLGCFDGRTLPRFCGQDVICNWSDLLLKWCIWQTAEGNVGVHSSIHPSIHRSGRYPTAAAFCIACPSRARVALAEIVTQLNQPWLSFWGDEEPWPRLSSVWHPQRKAWILQAYTASCREDMLFLVSGR